MADRLSKTGYRFKQVVALLFFVLYSGFLIAIAVSSRPYLITASNIIFLVVCVLQPLFILAPIVRRRFQLSKLAQNRIGIFVPTHSVFSSSHVVLDSEGQKKELPWNLFSRVVRGQTVALLYFKNSTNHLILARRKLEDPGRWGDFLEMIEVSIEKNFTVTDSET